MFNRHTLEKRILTFLTVGGLLTFVALIRKPPTKDWLIVFLFKAFISSIMDNYIVKKGWVKYPVSLSKWFDISLLFDYLLFPLFCLYYNQSTKSSSIAVTFFKTFMFSVPMTIIEYFLESKTNLIKYQKGWTHITSFIGLTVTFLVTRVFIAGVRKAHNTPVRDN